MLTISVRLRDGGYDAASADPRVAEWPPHPARVFCALVASARDEEDFDALRWLERSGQPQVRASSLAEVGRVAHAGYVVTNKRGGGGSQTWPGRTNNRRERTAVRARHDSFAIVWPGAEPDDGTLARLVRLAGRVPYVGRSTAVADVVVTVSEPSELDGCASFAAVPFGEAADGEWRVPYAGYVDALRDAYESGQRAWEVARLTPFREGDPAPPDVPAVAAPFDELLVLGFEHPIAPFDGRDVALLTTSLRRAVLDLVPDPLPALLSGHGADGRPHVAFLALPDVHHEHADGHVIGLAIAVPAELGMDDRRRIFRALDEGLQTLRVGRTQVGVALRAGPPRRALLPEWWSAAPRGRCTWTTATPLMLDRYLKRNADVSAEVAAAVVRAGYPEPAEVEVRRAAFVAGGITAVRWGAYVADRPRRPVVHARLRFPMRVTGPVLAGSMRYLGLGLFLPDRRAVES